MNSVADTTIHNAYDTRGYSQQRNKWEQNTVFYWHLNAPVAVTIYKYNPGLVCHCIKLIEYFHILTSMLKLPFHKLIYPVGFLLAPVVLRNTLCSFYLREQLFSIKFSNGLLLKR